MARVVGIEGALKAGIRPGLSASSQIPLLGPWHSVRCTEPRQVDLAGMRETVRRPAGGTSMLTSNMEG